MNKTEMAEKLAKKTGITQALAGDVIDAIFSTKPGEGIIAVELDAGRELAVAGFGKFYTRRTKARMGRNLKTGEEIQIAARTVAKFTPAKALKDRVAV